MSKALSCLRVSFAVKNKAGKNISFVFGGKASLPLEVFEKIAKAFVGERHLLKVEPEGLARSFSVGLALIGMVGSEPIAYTRLTRFLSEAEASSGRAWYELGSTWVHPDWRGLHIGTTLYELFLPVTQLV